jgi:hypothetical protein
VFLVAGILMFNWLFYFCEVCVNWMFVIIS